MFFIFFARIFENFNLLIILTNTLFPDVYHRVTFQRNSIYFEKVVYTVYIPPYSNYILYSHWYNSIVLPQWIYDSHNVRAVINHNNNNKAGICAMPQQLITRHKLENNNSDESNRWISMKSNSVFVFFF